MGVFCVISLKFDFLPIFPIFVYQIVGMSLKKDHKKWADLVIKGVNEIEAYLQVYPKAGKKTASNQLGKFRRDEGIQNYINENTKRIAKIIENKHIEALQSVEMENILTVAKKREILAKIVSGNYEVDEVDENGNTVKVKIKPKLNDILNAIDLDNKMSGDHYLAKPNQPNETPNETIVVVNDQTEPIKREDDSNKEA